MSENQKVTSAPSVAGCRGDQGEADRHSSSFYVENDEDCCSEDYDTSNGGSAEAKHFQNVCQAFANYSLDSMREVSRIEAHLQSLSIDDKDLLIEKIESRVTKIKDAVLTNQQFLNLILSDQTQLPLHLLEDENTLHAHLKEEVAVNAASFPTKVFDDNASDRTQTSSTVPLPIDQIEKSSSAQITKGEKAASKESEAIESNVNNAKKEPSRFIEGTAPTQFRNISKVRSTLRQFVRDWSTEGLAEREAAYGPLLTALQDYLPCNSGQKSPRVLCPGSGLGRLPFEVVRLGYSCQGNEFSYFMLLGSNLILNCRIPPSSLVIQPYCLSTSNRVNHLDHLVEVKIPDICPVDIVDAGHDFSMCAGEFVEVYWDQLEEWDAILTCFFIDTAKNVLQYIRTIARILRSGGLWANFGPLLYHFSDIACEVSVELSWEEIKSVIEKYFIIKKIEWRDAYYTTNHLSMMQVQYHCVHFVAIRNDTKVTGISNSVY